MTHTDTTAGPDLKQGNGQASRGRRRVTRLVDAFSLGMAIYGLMLWVYVAICGIVVPETLSLPLTHLIPFLREDTSGFLGFAISFVGFVVYRSRTRGLSFIRRKLGRMPWVAFAQLSVQVQLLRTAN
jgi:hypothetical protein